MSSTPNPLGLGTQGHVRYLSSELLLLNFIMTFVVSSPRFARSKYGLDHNVAPREDVARYADKAVSLGKLTQSQLDRIRRWEAAQANGVENFPLLVGAVVMSTLAGVDAAVVNRCGFVYTLARIAYSIAYIRITTETWSYSRSVLWWVGNTSCFYLLWRAGNLVSAARI